uniref:Uncharacterized protein n=1 Tax=Graphocephala atropunctata TaxID=36148 RepID=A0A1B6LJD8_9HEMI
MESMYNRNRVHYCNNLCCNQNSSQWEYFTGYNNNGNCEQKKMICEPGMTKGLMQSLKDKITSLQSDSVRFKFGKKPVKRKPNEYYYLMLRKISTLEKKLQNLECLFLSRTNGLEEDKHDSEYLCDYLTFCDSVRSLVDLANQLKEEIYTKSNTQFKNQNVFQLYDRIQVLESDLHDLALYLEQLQDFGDEFDRIRPVSREFRYTENIVPSNQRDGLKDKTKSQSDKRILQPEHKKSKSKLKRSKKSKKEEQPFDQTTINISHMSETLAELKEPLPSEVTITVRPDKIKSNKKLKRSKKEEKCGEMSSISPSRQFQAQIVNYYKSTSKTNKSKDNSQHGCNHYKHNGHTTFLDDKNKNSNKRSVNSQPCYHHVQKSSKISTCSCESCVAHEQRWRFLNKHNNNVFRQSGNTSVCSCSSCDDNSDRGHIPTYNPKVLFLKPENDKGGFNRNIRRINNFQRQSKKLLPQHYDVSYDEDENYCFCEPKMINVSHKKQGLKMDMRQVPTRQTNQCYHNVLYIPHHQYKLKNKVELKQKKQTKNVKRSQIPNFQEEKDEHIQHVYYYDAFPNEEYYIKKQGRQQQQHNEQETSNIHYKNKTNNKFYSSKKGHYERQFGGFRNQSNNLKKNFVSNSKFGKHFQNNENWFHDSPDNTSNSESDEPNDLNEKPGHVPHKKNLQPGKHLHIKFYEHEELEEHRKLPYNVEQNQKFKQGGFHQPPRFCERNRINDWPNDNWSKQWPPNWGRNKFPRWHHQNMKFNKPFIGGFRSFDSVNQNRLSSDDSSCHCRINVCDNPKCKVDNKSDDMVVFLRNNEDSSSLSEDSDLKKVINSLKDFETEVCGKCIVKEKKIKLVPNEAAGTNGKGVTKVIVKKEIIKCPSCRNKLDKHIFKATHSQSKNDIKDSKDIKNVQDSKSNKNLEEDKTSTKIYPEDIRMENTNKSRTNFIVNPIQKAETGDNKINGVWSSMQNKRPIPIFQTQVDQGDIFKNSNVQNIADSQKSLDLPNYGNTININIERGSYSVGASQEDTGVNKRDEHDGPKSKREESANKSAFTVPKVIEREESKLESSFINKMDARDENTPHFDKTTPTSKSSRIDIVQTLLTVTGEEEPHTAVKTDTNDVHKDVNKTDAVSRKSKSDKRLPSNENYLEENKNSKDPATQSKDKSIDKTAFTVQANRKLGCKDYFYSSNVPYKPLSQKVQHVFPSVFAKKVKYNASEKKPVKSKEILNYYPKISSINLGRRSCKQFKHKQSSHPRMSSKDFLRNVTRRSVRNYHKSYHHNLNETSSDTKLENNNNMVYSSVASESSFSVLNWEKVANKLKEQNLS